jgi:uncharacterized protein (DUF927 family)
MKNVIYLCAIIALSSCGKIKHLTQTNDTVDKVKTETTTTAEATIVETIDTTITLRPIQIDIENSIIDLVDTTKLVIDTDELEVKLSVDPITNKIKTRAKIKERIIPIQKTKISSIKWGEEKSSSIVHKDNSERKEVEKPKAATSFTWWLIIALIAAGAFTLLRFMPFKITRL